VLLLAGVLTGAIAGTSLGAGSGGGTSAALHVIPFPGTPDVTPASPVIFSSLRPAALAMVMVTGSRSGRHTGRLVALPHSDGTAFYPDRPFLPGERVVVRARLGSARAAAEPGDRGARTLRFSFGIGQTAGASRPGVSQDGARRARDSRSARSAASPPTSQSFRSEPGLHPPVVSFTGHLDAGSGDVFVTAQNIHQPGPMILDPQGRLVWFHPVSRGESMNLQVQHYRGHPVLTWWVGKFRQWGNDMILDTSYRTLAVVHGQNGLVADLHDFRITPQGTALIDAFHDTRADLSSVGGPRNGYVLDCAIQEIDIRTGRLLWEWHALGHVPLSASHAFVPSGSTPFDYFHINSIQQLPNGNLIISARNTWSVYEISKSTGRILWTVGGRDASFRMGRGTGFEWQHNARLSGQRLSLFDDGAAPVEEAESSALVLQLHPRSNSVSLVHRYTHSPSLLASSAGSAQILHNGDMFVGWGPEPEFSEYTPSGHQIFNGLFAWGTDSYRAFRFRWNAQPATPPVIALSRTSRGVTVYASWNGATQVRKWQLLEGLLPNHLTAQGLPYPRTGFETTIQLDNRPPYVAVQAMNASGRVLGTSKAVADPLIGLG
jgi:hypothetical protein